ncbi:hypothetical protein X975_09625, partial [Stegodyphus mimosarum]
MRMRGLLRNCGAQLPAAHCAPPGATGEEDNAHCGVEETKSEWDADCISQPERAHCRRRR